MVEPELTAHAGAALEVEPSIRHASNATILTPLWQSKAPWRANSIRPRLIGPPSGSHGIVMAQGAAPPRMARFDSREQDSKSAALGLDALDVPRQTVSRNPDGPVPK